MPRGVYARKPPDRSPEELARKRERIRELNRLATARYRARHPERLKQIKQRAYERRRAKAAEENARWRAENPEKVREIEARYRAAHLEVVTERQRAWRAANPDRDKEWKAANRDAVRRYASTRRARQFDAYIEDVDPRTVYEMHGGRCGICGLFIAGAFHVDHVIPIARGGAHGYINVQPAHPRCNQSKGAKLLR